MKNKPGKSFYSLFSIPCYTGPIYKKSTKKKKYLAVNGNFIDVTDKGKVVGVWANYFTKNITIEEPKKE